MARSPAKPDARRLQGPPRVREAQSGDHVDGNDAIDLASGYNLIPDAWQKPIILDWMARRRDGKWCHGRCGLAVPRQNGKNAIIEVRELFGLIFLGEAFLHTAHEVKTNRKAFKRLKHYFGESADDPKARYPDLNALVAEVRNTNGQEGIFLKDVWQVDGGLVRSKGKPEGDDVEFVARGGSIEFVARSNGSGRGYTVDVLVLDEAQHLSDEDLEAIRSSVSSAPLGNPQVIYAGTPPDREKTDTGVIWIRLRAQAGKDKRLCWTEYGVPDGPLPDLDDIEALYAANPSLEIRHENGAWGLSMDVVNDEKGDLSPEGYARERYGWWGNVEQAGGLVDLDHWATLANRAIPMPHRATIVVDVEPNRTRTCIGVAAQAPDGRILVMERTLSGTAGAARQIEYLTREHDILEVALNPRGQAAVLIPELIEQGIDYYELKNRDLGQACGAFLEGIPMGRYVHLAQKDMTAALRNATTRFIDQLEHWDRRDRTIAISPIVAPSTAAHRWDVLNAAAAEEPPPQPVAIKSPGRGGRQRRSHDLNTQGF